MTDAEVMEKVRSGVGFVMVTDGDAKALSGIEWKSLDGCNKCDSDGCNKGHSHANKTHSHNGTTSMTSNNENDTSRVNHTSIQIRPMSGSHSHSQSEQQQQQPQHAILQSGRMQGMGNRPPIALHPAGMMMGPEQMAQFANMEFKPLSAFLEKGKEKETGGNTHPNHQNPSPNLNSHHHNPSPHLNQHQQQRAPLQPQKEKFDPKQAFEDVRKRLPLQFQGMKMTWEDVQWPAPMMEQVRTAKKGVVAHDGIVTSRPGGGEAILPSGVRVVDADDSSSLSPSHLSSSTSSSSSPHVQVVVDSGKGPLSLSSNEKKNDTATGDLPAPADWDNVSEEEMEKIMNVYPVKYCDKCDAHKPPRTHHCSQCGTCVSRMDHHCIWLNNCVGINNHKYFMLFLLYVMCGLVYFFILSFLNLMFYGFPELDFQGIMFYGCFLSCGAFIKVG